MSRARDLADLAGKGVSSTLGSETPVSLGSGTASTTLNSHSVPSSSYPVTASAGTIQTDPSGGGDYLFYFIAADFSTWGTGIPSEIAFYDDFVTPASDKRWLVNLTDGTNTTQLFVKSIYVSPGASGIAYLEFWQDSLAPFPSWLTSGTNTWNEITFSIYETDITYTNPGGNTVPESLTHVRYDGTDYRVDALNTASSLISITSTSTVPASGDVELVGSNDKFTLTKRDGSTTTEFGFDPDTGNMSSDGDLLLGWQNIPAVGPYGNDFTITSFQHGFAPNDSAHEVSLNVPSDVAITAQTADGTLLGGNTRSGSSVDLQTYRFDPTQVAQMPGFLAGVGNKLTGVSSAAVGSFNTVDRYGFAAGASNTVTGRYAAVFGSNNTINSGGSIGLGFSGNDHGTYNENSVVHGTGSGNVHYLKRVAAVGDGLSNLNISVPDLPDAKLWVTYDTYMFDHTNDAFGVIKSKTFSARRTGPSTWALVNGTFPHQLDTQSWTTSVGLPPPLPAGNFIAGTSDAFLNFYWSLPIGTYLCVVMDIVVSHS